ncbi:hypothetical protein DFH07DRAFT_427210 [Mycena maculata]|uniref:Uncharacterized protein n=1 Tax=Mycena maculata TaxID=230809 RepID=A0AAD7JE89_9AGAR|nr:hypothetical protein DFH07DRAFT_427210 [Mycena maculata]
MAPIIIKSEGCFGLFKLRYSTPGHSSQYYRSQYSTGFRIVPALTSPYLSSSSCSTLLSEAAGPHTAWRMRRFVLRDSRAPGTPLLVPLLPRLVNSVVRRTYWARLSGVKQWVHRLAFSRASSTNSEKKPIDSVGCTINGSHRFYGPHLTARRIWLGSLAVGSSSQDSTPMTLIEHGTNISYPISEVAQWRTARRYSSQGLSTAVSWHSNHHGFPGSLYDTGARTGDGIPGQWPHSMACDRLQQPRITGASASYLQSSPSIFHVALRIVDLESAPYISWPATSTRAL